jgi:hypothetical protein
MDIFHLDPRAHTRESHIWPSVSRTTLTGLPESGRPAVPRAALVRVVHPSVPSRARRGALNYQHYPWRCLGQ